MKTLPPDLLKQLVDLQPGETLEIPDLDDYATISSSDHNIEMPTAREEIESLVSQKRLSSEDFIKNQVASNLARELAKAKPKGNA